MKTGCAGKQWLLHWYHIYTTITEYIPFFKNINIDNFYNLIIYLLRRPISFYWLACTGLNVTAYGMMTCGVKELWVVRGLEKANASRVHLQFAWGVGCLWGLFVPRSVFTPWSRSPRWVSGWSRRWMFLLTEPFVCWLSWATGRAGTHIISNSSTHTHTVAEKYPKDAENPDSVFLDLVHNPCRRDECWMPKSLNLFDLVWTLVSGRVFQCCQLEIQVRVFIAQWDMSENLWSVRSSSRGKVFST